jgi:spectinomycin phosphotransferase
VGGGRAAGRIVQQGRSLTPLAVLEEVLRAQYGIEPTLLEPTDRGMDFAASVHRVFVGGESPRFVVKSRPAAAARDAAAAIARHLADADVPGVVAPIRTLAGDVAARAGQLSVTVYPFIHGRGGIDVALSDASWRKLGRLAQRLHETTLPGPLAELVPVETYRPAEVALIAEVDAALDAASRRDQLARTVTDLWRTRREQILALTARTEALGDALRRRSLPLVTCHADMHAGNVIVDRRARLWLIDWDEIVRAPKERDLMFTVNGGISTDLVDSNATARFLEGYGHCTIDEEALAYYRHAWAVQDVGGYAWRILVDGSATDDVRDTAARVLVGLFRPGQIVDLAERSIAA